MLSPPVTALETLRLDLLRVAAGQASLDELTRNLRQVRDVGETVDRRLDAEREVKGVTGFRARIS